MPLHPGITPAHPKVNKPPLGAAQAARRAGDDDDPAGERPGKASVRPAGRVDGYGARGHGKPPASTASAGLPLVDSAFAVLYVAVPPSAGSPIRTQSVNVPPMSMPTWNTRASAGPIDQLDAM